MQSAYRLITWIDTVNDAIGRAVSGLAIVMVLVQFSIVVLRYVFSLNFILMQESVMYLHATLFMLGAAYTLLYEGHVRVDIFYRTASVRQKACVDFIGALLFLVPVCGLVLWASVPYVAASWAMMEGSPETSGLPAVYLLKSLILAFSVLMAMQGVALALRAVLTLKGGSIPTSKLDGVDV